MLESVAMLLGRQECPAIIMQFYIFATPGETMGHQSPSVLGSIQRGCVTPWIIPRTEADSPSTHAT